jgi:hypothetical protein
VANDLFRFYFGFTASSSNLSPLLDCTLQLLLRVRSPASSALKLPPRPHPIWDVILMVKREDKLINSALLCPIFLGVVLGQLATAFKTDGMQAYVELIQRREKEHGIDVLKHQKWFDSRSCHSLIPLIPSSLEKRSADASIMLVSRTVGAVRTILIGSCKVSLARIFAFVKPSLKRLTLPIFSQRDLLLLLQPSRARALPGRAGKIRLSTRSDLFVLAEPQIVYRL